MPDDFLLSVKPKSAQSNLAKKIRQFVIAQFHHSFGQMIVEKCDNKKPP